MQIMKLMAKSGARSWLEKSIINNSVLSASARLR